MRVDLKFDLRVDLGHILLKGYAGASSRWSVCLLPPMSPSPVALFELPRFDFQSKSMSESFARDFSTVSVETLKKKREWSSIFVVIELRAIRIDREVLKYEVGEEVIVGEP